MGGDEKERWKLPKLAVLACLLAGCVFIDYYSHFIRGIEVVYTHLFYLPIVLTGVWWGKRVLFVSASLAFLLLASHLLAGVAYPITDDLLRAGMFLIVGGVLGREVEERNKLQIEAMKEKNTKIKEMENHARYVDRVAHELRNPLQVLMGALDSVEMERLNEGQKELIKMLNEATEEIGRRIKELTGGEES